MLKEKYEQHVHTDANFPIIFHLNHMRNLKPFMAHWHENIEILCFTHGESEIIINGFSVTAKKGDIVIINSGTIHDIRIVSGSVAYYCLILDRNFCAAYDLLVEQLYFENAFKSETVENIFFQIALEFEKKSEHYKSVVKALSIQLLVECTRNHSTSLDRAHEKHSAKNRMVKDAILYMRANFTEHITVDEICEDIGFSKYYFCREFKRLTELTCINYLNNLRCNYAKELLLNNCTVTEAAFKSGFDNLSYFTKVYKKHFGVLPSKVAGMD